MDVPAVIKDERTFVPLRPVAEEMGCEVKWDEENNIANVIKYNMRRQRRLMILYLMRQAMQKSFLRSRNMIYRSLTR